MSWESATAVLFEHSPTLEQVSALSEFVTKHHQELEECDKPQYRALLPVFAKFASKLFRIEARNLSKDPSNEEKLLREVVEKASTLIPRTRFFSVLIKEALQQCDVLLLEVVYSLLFTEIRFNTDITRLWLEQRQEARKTRSKQPSDLAYALEVLTTVEFINLRQDWMLTKPDRKLLESVNSAVNASNDLFLNLTWGLALFIMAEQLHRIDTQSEEIVDIEALMKSIQPDAGTHWSSLLLDRISASVPGLGTMIEAHSVISGANLRIASKVRLSQTVADVISRLAPITEPNADILRALALTVRDYEGLKEEKWFTNAVYTSAHSGMPFSLIEAVFIAQTLSRNARVAYFEQMHSYICEVDGDCLDLPDGAKALDSTHISQPVRNNKVVTVLSARSTDRQGALEIETNTRGTLVAFEGNLCLVSWHFDYNGWSLLGRILENAAIDEGANWKSQTTEILRLVTLTARDNIVLSSVSSGLARGDIVDFVTNNLQIWLQKSYSHPSLATVYEENIGLALEFLKQYAHYDPMRIWVILSNITWYSNLEVLIDGVKEILNVLLNENVSPSNNLVTSDSPERFNLLQKDVMNRIALAFSSQYLVMEPFNVSVLAVIELLLPYSEVLQQSFLSSSELRETAIAPLLTNLGSRKVLEFCSQCLGMISSNPSYTSTSYDRRQPIVRKQTHIERKLFEKTSDLVALFMDRAELRQLILNIWTMLIENPDSPSLLAFLTKPEIENLQKELINILTNKLEPVETIGDLAAFLAASRQQEGLLDMLRTVMPHIEKRSQIELRDGQVSDMNALRAIFDSLKLSQEGLQSSTMETLEKVVSLDLDRDLVGVQTALKISAVELLSIQMEIKPAGLESLAQQIGGLTTKLGTIYDSSSSAQVNEELENPPSTEVYDIVRDVEAGALVHLSKLLLVWCEFLRVASIKSTVSNARKSDWGRRLVLANNFEYIRDFLGTGEIQKAEISRFETGLFIFIKNGTATFELVKLLRDKLMELVEQATLGFESSRTILRALIQSIAIIMTKIHSFSEKIDDISNEDVCQLIEEMFNVTIIKQLQLGIDQDLLKPQLIILDMSLLLLGRFDTSKNAAANATDIDSTELQQSLQRAIVESACDRALIYKLGEIPPEKSQFGELLLQFVQRILPLSEYAAYSFMNNGLITVFVDAPLSRAIQQGGITQYSSPGLHSVWRNGILPTLNNVVSVLGVKSVPEVKILLDLFSKQVLTCIDQWKAGYISLELIEETAMLYTVMYHTTHSNDYSSQALNTRIDNQEMLKDIKFLLNHQNYLSERLIRGQNLDTVVQALEDFQSVLEVK